MTNCPDCEGEIELPDGATLGEIVSCPDCGLELQVTRIDGGKVDLSEISMEKEDWGQ